MKTCSTVRSSDWGEITRTPLRAFLSFPDKNRICPHQHRMGSFRGLNAGERYTRHCLCELLRPIDTDILCENLPATAATSRFIAYQTRLFYHICFQIATLFFCDNCRTLNVKTMQNIQNIQKMSHFVFKASQKPTFCGSHSTAQTIFFKNSHKIVDYYYKSNKNDELIAEIDAA